MANKELPAGKRGLAPIHPGIAWRDIIENGLDTNISDAARRMSISRQVLHKVLNGDSPVTPNLSLRFSRLCGKGDEGADIWVRLQADYDLWRFKKEMQATLNSIEPAPEKKETAHA